jgi:type IV pilus assembly protein PilA
MKTRFSRVIILVSILILVAIGQAIAQQSKAEPPNDQTAIGCLRTINTAEVAYSSTYSKGYSPTLAALGMTAGQSQPTADAAELIDEHLTTGKMGGYLFVYKPGARDAAGNVTAYTVTARPGKWKKGPASFFTDQGGVIRWTRENRAATPKDPPIDSLLEQK